MTVNRPPLDPPPARLGWLVTANAARARVFERDDDNGAMREIADRVHPASREKGATLGRDRPGHAYKGQASTAFEPPADPRARERAHFAQELAQWLEDAVRTRRPSGLVLLASNPFLGELRAALGPAARPLLKASIALDLTALQGSELEHRVSQVLSEHAAASAPAPPG